MTPHHRAWRLAAPPLSVDELPDVFEAEMSVVGPRPSLDHEVAPHDDDMSQRLRAPA